MGLIIGLVGRNCCGKDSVADYLKKKSFYHYSLSDILREELAKEGSEVTRENLIKKGNKMREEQGPEVLAKKAAEKVLQDKNYVINSIRNPYEVDELKKLKGFVLVFVDAGPEVRFKRMKERATENDPKTFEAFLELEKAEEENADPTKQSIKDVIKKADYTLKNNSSSYQVLYDDMGKLISPLFDEHIYVRPSWDEYFLELAKMVGSRGTCDRGRSGCIIVKDKRIMVTGYVGSPPGLPHCDEVGHLMKKVTHEDGTESMHCMRTIHAEQNAICQAARMGIPIEGGTLYCKMEPCRVCAMMIISCGIKRVVCEKRYHRAQETRDMFKEAGVQLDVIKDELEDYGNK